jgi:hypothetical protein
MGRIVKKKRRRRHKKPIAPHPCAKCREQLPNDVSECTSPYYKCDKKAKEHDLCFNCFAEYAKQCCEAWKFGDCAISIKCHVSDCNFHPEASEIKKVLTFVAVADQGIWVKYMQIQIKEAVQKSESNQDQIEVGCCRGKTVSYVKPTRDYWDSIEKQKKLRKFENESKETKQREQTPQCVFLEFSDGPLNTEEKQDPRVPGGDTSGSQYLVCQHFDCNGAYCLKCESFFKKALLKPHVCRSQDPLEDLYAQVVEALAESASRSCPVCGCIGTPMDGKTEVICQDCNEKFYYCCGLSEIQGRMAGHPSGPNLRFQCPTYLQQRWGDKVIASEYRLDGDPVLAQKRFHRDLRVDAMSKIKKELKDDALWVRMENEKFPDQPLIGEKYTIKENSVPFSWKYRAHMLSWLKKATKGLFWLYAMFYLSLYLVTISEGIRSGGKVGIY